MMRASAGDMGGLHRIMEEARSVALRYRALTGRPLGVTGEIGEFEAIRLLGLELAPVRCPGFDATDQSGRRYQIKARCVLPGARRSQRLGSIKKTADWDAVLMVLLNEALVADEVWEADRLAVIAALDAPGSRSRNERGALDVNKFKSIGRRVWPADIS